jgi:hypothetical protein
MKSASVKVPYTTINQNVRLFYSSTSVLEDQIEMLSLCSVSFHNIRFFTKIYGPSPLHPEMKFLYGILS